MHHPPFTLGPEPELRHYKGETQSITEPLVSDSMYSETDIHPGVYEVVLSSNELCWKSAKQSVNINNEQVEIPPFIQTGYQLQFVSSHEAKVIFVVLVQ